MHFFNLYLRDDQWERLRRCSSGRVVSAAELVRRSLDLFVPAVTGGLSGAEVLAFKAVTSSGEVYLGRVF